MAMSVGENSVTCRSGVRPHQVLSMMNNVPNVRTSEAVDTVQPRRRVWRLDFETEVDLGPPARPKSVVSRGDQGEIVEVLIVLSKGTTHQLNLMIRLDLV